MAAVAHEKGGQRVALHIRVVGKNARSRDDQRHIFRRGVGVVVGHGRVVHGCNVDGDRGEIAVGGAVVGAIGESVAAVGVGGRKVSETAIGIEIQHSMTDVTYEHRSQRVALHIRVVGKNAGGGDGQTNVFQRGISVVVGDGRVVHGRNVDGDGGEIAVGGAVVGAIGESVAAVVVGGRKVSETAIGIEIQHSMTDVTYKHRSQRVALHIRVIGKNAGGGDGQTNVFQRGISVGHRDRGVIHRGDVDGDRGEIAVGGAVVGAVGERVAAVVVGGGKVSEAAIGIEIQHSMSDVAHQPCGQSVALHIRVIGKNAGGGDGQTNVFQRGISVVVGDGRVVHGRNVDGDRGEIAVGGAVVGAVGESVAAVVVGGRAVSEAAVGVESQDSMSDVAHQPCGQSVALHIRVIGKNARSRDGQTNVFQS